MKSTPLSPKWEKAAEQQWRLSAAKKKKKNEIFPYATIWMKLEGIMLSEISQRKKNTAWSHLHVEFYLFIYLFIFTYGILKIKAQVRHRE